MNRRLAIPATALLAILIAWLAPGCADTNSMPTRPEAASTSGWTTVYQPFTLQDLTAVWGHDADDVWMVGDRGTILHHDGVRLTDWSLERGWHFRDVDGCATDEVWAAGGRTVVRWDGRRWTPKTIDGNYYFYKVLCEAPDEVYFGGVVQRYPDPEHAVVRRYTGRGWKDWDLPTPRSAVHELWRPHADGPLFAIVQDSVRHAYRIDDGKWTLLDWPAEPLDADGDLVTFDNHDYENPTSLYRVETDHSLTPICEQFDGERILNSRAIVAGYDRGLQFEFDCSFRTILSATPDNINDIAVPRRPGAASPALLVVGNDGMAMIGGWQPDWSVNWRTLSPQATFWFYRPMVGDETHVFIPYVDQESRGVFVRSAEGWHAEPLTYLPEGLFFLESGDLVAWNAWRSGGPDGEISRRDAGGVWHDLPPVERELRGVWGASADDLVAMTSNGEFLRLTGGVWVVEDQLGIGCEWFAACAPDHMFAVLSRGYLQRWLLHYDGEAWRDITPADAEDIYGVYLGPHSGTLYAGFRENWHYLPLQFRNGQWEDYPAGHEHSANQYDTREAADGYLYQCSGQSIYRLHSGTWKQVYSGDIWLNDYVVDPVFGVHAVDQEQRLHHHPYRPR